MMVSTLVFLLAPLTLSVTDARGLGSSSAQRRSVSSSIKDFKRLNQSEEEARADKLYPGWRSCCVSAWELGNHYEADLLTRNRHYLRTSLRKNETKWPSRIIPYRLRVAYFNEDEIKEIHATIEEFNKFTCVKFRNFTETDKDYVDIHGTSDGCATFVGRQGGPQRLNLEPPICLRRRGNMYHILMHALGFVHEHNSPSRDNYVYIINGMVAKGKEEWVKKYNSDMVTDYGYNYDLNSIMHGSRTFASRNKSSTIEPIDPFVMIGNKEVLSPLDILKVHWHFNCTKLTIED